MTITSDDREGTRTFAELFDRICSNVGHAIRGKDDVIRLTVTCLVARGHLLLEDVPGVGKTSLAKALARSVDARFGRVQFTPDLLPSDVLGSSVWNQARRDLRVPARARCSPSSCSATRSTAPRRRRSPRCWRRWPRSRSPSTGDTYPLHRPFMVIATQNPLEHHGTFPLPESQLDRFLMKLSIGYPGRVDELALLREEDHDRALADLRAGRDRRRRRSR